MQFSTSFESYDMLLIGLRRQKARQNSLSIPYSLENAILNQPIEFRYLHIRTNFGNQKDHLFVFFFFAYVCQVEVTNWMNFAKLAWVST